jgi:hypothetical protein
LIADENWLVKKAPDEWCRCMEKLIQMEALLIRLRMLLPMAIKGGLKTATDETGSVPMERRSMGIPS